MTRNIMLISPWNGSKPMKSSGLNKGTIGTKLRFDFPYAEYRNFFASLEKVHKVQK